MSLSKCALLAHTSELSGVPPETSSLRSARPEPRPAPRTAPACERQVVQRDPDNQSAPPPCLAARLDRRARLLLHMLPRPAHPASKPFGGRPASAPFSCCRALRSPASEPFGWRRPAPAFWLPGLARAAAPCAPCFWAFPGGVLLLRLACAAAPLRALPLSIFVGASCSRRAFAPAATSCARPASEPFRGGSCSRAFSCFLVPGMDSAQVTTAAALPSLARATLRSCTVPHSSTVETHPPTRAPRLLNQSRRVSAAPQLSASSSSHIPASKVQGT